MSANKLSFIIGFVLNRRVYVSFQKAIYILSAYGEQDRDKIPLYALPLAYVYSGRGGTERRWVRAETMTRGKIEFVCVWEFNVFI